MHVCAQQQQAYVLCIPCTVIFGTQEGLYIKTELLDPLIYHEIAVTHIHARTHKLAHYYHYTYGYIEKLQAGMAERRAREVAYQNDFMPMPIHIYYNGVRTPVLTLPHIRNTAALYGKMFQ